MPLKTKLLLKAIYELKYISKKEFGLLLYRTSDQKKTYKEGIEEILNLRSTKKDICKKQRQA